MYAFLKVFFNIGDYKNIIVVGNGACVHKALVVDGAPSTTQG